MSNIVFTSFFNDGTVSVSIDGKRYVYHTDPVYHSSWQFWSRYKPGKVLNDIKKHIKLGKAKLIEKPTNNQLSFKDWLVQNDILS